jgi:hypothetical protein
LEVSRIEAQTEGKILMFGHKKGQVKKWRSRARMIDPHKTKLTLETSSKAVHVPPWMTRSLSVEKAVGVQAKRSLLPPREKKEKRSIWDL